MRRTTKVVLSLIALALVGIAYESRERSIFLIPEGYQGDITIFLERPYGEPMLYENGSRVFQIPPEGVMFSQFGETSGFADYKVYFVSKNGERKEVPYIGRAEIDTTILVDSEAVYIYRSGYGGVILNDDETLKNVPGYKPGDVVKTFGMVLSSPQNWDSISGSALEQHRSFFKIAPYKLNK